MIRIEEEKREEKHVSKQAKPERMVSRDGEGSELRSRGSESHGFDRTAYQREYMRKWRAKRQEKDR